MRLDAIQGEGELEVHRLLTPERAVIVERGNALLNRYEVRRVRIGHSFDECR